MANPPLIRKLGRAERALTPHNIAHQIDTIRAKVDEIIIALANMNTNMTGSPSGTSPSAPSFNKWTGVYQTSAADGVATSSLRSDTKLYFPPALSTGAGATTQVTLTNDATEGALLTSANTFSANSAAIKAPNATNTFRIGKYGNISMAGSALVDQTLCNINKTDYNEAAQQPTGVGITLTNTGAATARGFGVSLTGTALNGASTVDLVGCNITLAAGNTTNNNFTSNISAYRFTSLTATAQTVGTAIASITAFEAGGTANSYVLTRVAITNIYGFRARGGATLLTSAAVTNFTGFRCEAITTGTNRYGVDVAAITTGTPTNSMGMQIGGHTVGTNRYGVNIGAFTGGTTATGVEVAAFSGGTTMRSFRGGNTFENTATDFLCSTTAKGLICKDSQGTPEYWRTYIDSTGTKGLTYTQTVDGYVSCLRTSSPTGSVTLNIQDTGTTAPSA